MTEEDKRAKQEDETDEIGAEGGTGGSFDTPPPLPEKDDDTPLGDTDQHSQAGA